MGRVFASSDWHGCWNVAEQVFDFLKEDDILYFIGDACDRGPNGIKIINKLFTRPNTIYIKGNHEDILADVVPYLIDEQFNYASRWLDFNGGEQTWKDMEKMSDQKKMWYVGKINQMPFKEVYHSPKGHDVILEHAGYSPFACQHRSHDPLWDRHHFYDDWNENFYDEDDELKPETTYLVHGHTPVQYLEFDYGYKGQPQKTKEMIEYGMQWNKSGNCDWVPEIIRYCDGHKIDLDLCTIVSNRIALLDLDTFEVIYFDDKKEQKGVS